MPSSARQRDDVATLDPLVVRRLTTIAEYRQCERLQERVWGIDDISGIPLLNLRTAQENGGLVLGAFISGDVLVGFVYSFLGLAADRRLKHCSVLLAVAHDYRGQGIGTRLKLPQREAALAQGIDLITWTFDPLLAVNAQLNLQRLGCLAREYRVNHYDTGRGLNVGLDTDRLVVEWRLREQPDRRLAALRSSAVPVAAVRPDPATGLPRPVEVRMDADTGALLLPIPADLDALKTVSLPLAREWRLQTRTLFETYLGRGYAVVGFQAESCPTYLLARDWLC